MTAGIYLITFEPSGEKYIGKSKHLDKRWEQHLDKLTKHKHAEKMQQAYKNSSSVNFSVILECHEDHIDLMEAYFIQRFQPELNTQIPECNYNWGKVSTEFLKLSTWEHFEKVTWAANRIEELLDSNKELRVEVAHYRYRGKQGKQIKELEEDCEYLRARLRLWEEASWWKRLFM